MKTLAVTIPKAIFFDWDGTLADSFSFLENAHNNVLQSLGLPPFAPGAFVQYFGKPREKIYPALYGPQREEAQKRFETYVLANHTKMLKPVPDAEYLLKTCTELGITMGVVSNKKPEFVNAEIDVFGWRKYFIATVGAREAANDKPSADPLFLAVQRAGLEPDMRRIWYAGDTDIDQKCAKTAKSYFIFIEYCAGEHTMRLQPEEGRIVKNCTELAELLLQSVQNRIQSTK